MWNMRDVRWGYIGEADLGSRFSRIPGKVFRSGSPLQCYAFSVRRFVLRLEINRRFVASVHIEGD
jgi:hypothetical protein